MAINFKQTKLSANSTSSYRLEEFNGVDYTTTPTKVTDTRAIDISNYLPEGNSLVKRYGYEKLLSNGRNAKNSSYGIGWASVRKKAYVFGEYLIILGAGIYNYDANNTNQSTTVTNGVISVGYSSLISGVSYPAVPSVPDNDRYVFLEGDNKLYLIRDGSYYVFDPSQTQKKFVKLIEDGAIVTGQESNIYTPTIALNYQPIDSLNKSLSFQQLNILNPSFKIELFYQTTANSSGGIDKIKRKYDIGSLINTSNFTIDSVVANTGVISSPNNTATNILCSMEGELVDTNARGSNQVRLSATKDGNYIIVNMTDSSVTTDTNTTPEYKFKGSPFVKLTITCKITDTSYTNKCQDFLKSKVGTIYGVKNAADRFFAGSTPNAPHTDWHTLDDENGNPLFTYFGTDTYNAIGSSQSEIVGYSYLNDGSLAIIKDNKDIANIFIRTGQIKNTNESYSVTDINNNTVTYDYIKSVEVYPTISTGLLVKSIDAHTKFTLYDNKLIFNAEDGVYYLNLNNTTSNQSYLVKELSYYIRNDLSKDISSSSICTDNKFLYVARKNKNGQLRVYVADKDKYSFINSEAQYNWWVLDGIPAFDMFEFQNSLWFLDESYELYKMKDKEFTDTGRLASDLVFGAINTYIYVDDTNGDIIFDTSENSDFAKILNDYMFDASIDKDNIEEHLYNFKNNYGITFDNDVAVYMPQMKLDGEEIRVGIIGAHEITTSTYSSYLNYFNQNGTVGAPYYDYNSIYFIVPNTNKAIDFVGKMQDEHIFNDGILYRIKTYKEYPPIVEYLDEGKIKITLGLRAIRVGLSRWEYTMWDGATSLTNDPSAYYKRLIRFSVGSARNSCWLIMRDKVADFEKMYATYNSTKYDLEDCKYIKGYGWTNKVTGDFIAETLNFTEAYLSYKGASINISQPYEYETGILINGMPYLVYNKPIKSSWYGKFTDLGTIDTLKTTKAIHFVPETRRGGFTKVGYRTNRKDKDFNSNDLGVDFNNIDFDNFSFEGNYFAKSYSSKKKIKNFSFIQLKFESPKAEDSTICYLSITYLYTKNNKGVK